MRTQLMNQVRSKYQLPSKKSVFFSKDEVRHIVESITGQNQDWTDCGDYMETYLTAYGWREQLTIDTHPTMQNLNWLLSYQNQTTSNINFNVRDLIKNIPQHVADQITGISIDEKQITFHLR
jgi:hypothetical protein